MTELTVNEFSTAWAKPGRWPALAIGVVIGVVAAAIVGLVLDGSDNDSKGSDQVTAELATVPAETRDLIEEVDWIGDLTYGKTVSINASTDGTVTATVEAGDVLRRGDVVVEIDEQSMVLLYGQVPAWRDLSEGVEGADVEQLEANLVALGYDPESTVSVDEEFTANTSLMVERWQEDIGVEVTGEVAASDIVVATGPVSVTTAPLVGDPARAGDSLGSLQARSVITDVVGAATGIVSEVVDVDTIIAEGTFLYIADEVPVIATANPMTPSTEESEDSESSDIEPVYVVVEPGLRVSGVAIEVGAEITQPIPVLTLEEQTLSVVVPVELDASDDWFVQQEVSVTLPDESVVGGLVREVGTVAQRGGQGVAPTINVIIDLLDAVDDDLPASEVTVTVAGDSVLNALAVPSRALVALSEGGFAVERMQEDGTAVMIAVDTGAFDDGWVEVESSQLAPGDEVVVPQ